MSIKKSFFLAFFCPLGCDLAFNFRQFARKRRFFCLKKGVFAGFRGCWYTRAVISGALFSESFQVFRIFSNAKPVRVVMCVGIVSELDSRIILSKFVVSGVSRCPRFHTGAKHHNTFRERVNSVRNTCEQVTQFSRLDGCVAYQILHLCQARAFLSVSRGSHTGIVSNVFYSIYGVFVFSASNGRSFSQDSPLGDFPTDAPAQIRDAQKTGLLNFARGMGGQQKGRWNGYARGTDTCLLKSFF